jgi:hypothetical protein
MFERCCSVLCVLPVFALAACASEPAHEVRLLVQATPALANAAGVASQASRSSGSAVRYLSASGGGWHALALSCRAGAECDQAVSRLRADSAQFPTVQLDERKRIVSPLAAP